MMATSAALHRWQPGGEFHFHFIFVSDDCLRGLGYFVTEDIFLRDNSGSFQVEHQCVLGLCEFGVIVAVGGLNEDGIAIDLDHDHDIFVSPS